MSKDSQKAN